MVLTSMSSRCVHAPPAFWRARCLAPPPPSVPHTRMSRNGTQIALFALDPTTGNTLGFKPSSFLMPLDAFEMFDTDKSGSIDEDEFAFCLEYLGVPVTDDEQERLFQKYDEDHSGVHVSVCV